ncbi:hypothetical protein CFC21_090225 [Triticum aestivum]|uniref:PGG domain-containing protein n=2 Tax=Triticum aestivum TaxID=4565 RepID=A0A9R1MRP4_WHEAT|nr:hypothetical protein CFC21_090225 [Triticum aestivum]
MSEELAMLGRAGVVGDSSHPQHEDILSDHSPQMSIDELLEVIKRANGMPVLFVPSGDGRLGAIAVDGLQSLMPTNRGEGSEYDEKKEQAFRSWMLLLASLVAAITFTAGLTPPGGFWSVDDKDNKFVAGEPIMRDKSRSRYAIFQTGNIMAFYTSLMIIGLLAKNRNNKTVISFGFILLVALCFVCLVFSFISGSWQGPIQGAVNVVLVLALNVFYMTLLRIISWCSSILSRRQGSPESVP